MPVSKSAIEFQERAGLRPLQNGPRPRVRVRELKVNSLPLADPQPEQRFLLGNEGSSPTDRGATKPWPHQETA